MEMTFVISGIFIILGLYTIIKGRIPFIKKYSGVKNIKRHCQIEGVASLICGLLIIFSHFVSIRSVTMMIIILGICILTIAVEIVLKVI